MYFDKLICKLTKIKRINENLCYINLQKFGTEFQIHIKCYLCCDYGHTKCTVVWSGKQGVNIKANNVTSPHHQTAMH